MPGFSNFINPYDEDAGVNPFNNGTLGAAAAMPGVAKKKKGDKGFGWEDALMGALGGAGGGLAGMGVNLAKSYAIKKLGAGKAVSALLNFI